MKKMILTSVLMASLTPLSFAEKINRDSVEDIPVSINIPSPVKVSAPLFDTSNAKMLAASTGGLGFNDYFYEYQTTFLPRQYLHDGIGLTKAVHGFSPLRPITVGVIDGGFFSGLSDVNIENGYRFGDSGAHGETRKRGEDFLIDPLLPNAQCEDSLLEDGHGTAVSAIISAKQNNNLGIAGIANVETVSARALDCGVGGTTHMADAIVWLSAGTIDDFAFNDADYPIRNNPVDIINMSLGAQIDYCPDFLQDAIKFAQSKGVLIVVSAGNNAEDASNFSPANCEGVIVVAATGANFEPYGTDMADFTNYGDNIDVSAPGEAIASLSTSDNDLMLWSGTSFSSPIYTGLASHLRQRLPNEGWDTITSIIDLSANALRENTLCYVKGCGSGVINAQIAAEMANSIDQNNAYVTLSHALSVGQFCDETLYQVANGAMSRLCNSYEAHIPSLSEQRTAEVFRFPKTQAMSPAIPLPVDAVSIATINEPKAILSDIDGSAYDYGFRLCEANKPCEETLYRISLPSQNAPAICDGI